MSGPSRPDEVPTGGGVVVLGSANLDVVTAVARIPGPGETVIGGAPQYFVGGKGANQALAAARAGAPTTLIAAVGSDASAERIAAELVASDVTLALRHVEDGTPTGTALITVDESGENSIVVIPGANASLSALEERERALIRTAAFVVLQLEVPLDAVERATELATGTVVLNASPVTAIPRDLLDRVGILIVNEHEADALLGDEDDGPGVADPAVIAVALAGPTRSVVLTLGAAGAVVALAGAGHATGVPALRVPVVDTTGAGDTFCGALVAALHAGEELPAAARFATAASALSVQTAGAAASIPSLEQIRRLFDG